MAAGRSVIGMGDAAPTGDGGTGPPARPLRVMLAEDQYLGREGTRRLLQEHGGVDVVAVAGDYDEVLAEARRCRPDAVLMDVKMPPTYSMEGIRAAHVLREELPGIGILVLTQHDDEGYVWALLQHGVEGLGYLHKVRVGDLEQVVRALHEVANGGSVLDPRIVARLLDYRRNKPGSPLAELTAGERDVLALMAEGMSNRRIGDALHLSTGAVEKRIAVIFSKLALEPEAQLNRRVAAVLIYLREAAELPATPAPRR